MVLMSAAPRPLLIGVDGRSGAGKTQLVARLRHRLQERGHAVVVFSLDEIYPGWDGLGAGVKQYAHSILPQLASGRPVQYRRWDWSARGPGAGVDGALGPAVTLPSGDIVLCEGVGATAAEARRWLDLAVWVEAPERLRQRRALERDGDTYRGHWQQWADQEEQLFHDSAGNGQGAPGHDVVVDTAEPHDTPDSNPDRPDTNPGEPPPNEGSDEAASLLVRRIVELLQG